MRDPDVRARRKAMLDQPHVAPLAKYAKELASKGRGDVPMPDPFLGGINARVLFLYEKPGPKAHRSGFISPNNDDPTAAKTWQWHKDICWHQADRLVWNTIPWWDGGINFTNEDREAGIDCLNGLIDLLPRLRVVVLVGRAAQKARHVFEDRGITIINSDHPSPKVRAIYPKRWAAIPGVWKQAKDIIDSPAAA